MSDALQICNQGIQAVLTWFEYIMTQLRAWPFIWGTLGAMLVFRYILLPMFEGVVIKPEEKRTQHETRNTKTKTSKKETK